MPVSGYLAYFHGSVRTSYHSPTVAVEAGRAELDNTVAEFNVKRAAGGMWSGTTTADLFGDGVANNILEGYIAAGTKNVPFLGVKGFTATDKAEIMLSRLFSPVGVGSDADGRWKSTLKSVMDSRLPLYNGQVLMYTQNGAGLTGAANGVGVNLGAVPAGSELIVVALAPHWPTMGGTAAATITLEHDAADDWLSPTTAVVTAAESTGANPMVIATGTPEYAVWIIDGDSDVVTDTWWRITVGTVTATVWPIAAAQLVVKDW